MGEVQEFEEFKEFKEFAWRGAALAFGSGTHRILSKSAEGPKRVVNRRLPRMFRLAAVL
jgi:hypothetical protein